MVGSKVYGAAESDRSRRRRRLEPARREVQNFVQRWRAHSAAYFHSVTTPGRGVAP